MVVKGQNKLRLALGSVKDHASVGKAMIYNRDGLSSIDVAVLRATGHENSPIDDKHMHEILFLVSNSSSDGSIAYLSQSISRRLNKTHNRFVALKTLLLVHRLLRGGDRKFEEGLRKAFLSDFLEERMGWIINQAGKLEPILFQGLQFRFHEETSIEMVFHRLPKFQLFLDKVLNCSEVLLEISPSDHCIIRAAMRNILRESFQVYKIFCEGVVVLTESFFEFKDPARVLALDVLKKASKQSYQLFDFYEQCKRSLGSKNLDYPSVQIITRDQVSFMIQFLNHSTERTEISTSQTESSTLICHSIYDDATMPPAQSQATVGSKTGQEQTSTSKTEISSLIYDNVTMPPAQSQATLGSKTVQEDEKEIAGTYSNIFSCNMETKISTVWVEFD